MSLWLESGIYFVSMLLNRMSDEWKFMGVGVLWWIFGCFIVSILIRNFIYDV